MAAAPLLPQREAPVPAELTAALAADPAASAAFDALDRTARYLLVLPLLKARTPATRRRRLAAIMNNLADQASTETGRRDRTEPHGRRVAPR